jgi:DNA repair protein RecN (Recombination protein N)
MLELLRIRDLALIEDVELEFSPAMNVLTGETGAGKSFILRAVDFLTGERMDAALVRPGKERAVVEALFVTSEGETVIRRELSAETGRSRVYVNDRLSSQEAIREMRPGLIVHTSQHGQQKLLSPSHQARLLDECLPPASGLAESRGLLAEMRALLEKKRATAERAAELERQREFLEYQREEIRKVAPQPGEEEELETLKEALKAQERAGECVQRSLELLCGEGGVGSLLAELSRQMDHVAALAPRLAPERDAVEEFRIRLGELELALRKGPMEQMVEGDLDRVEERLFAFSRLKRSLKRTLPEILGLRDEVEENLSFLDSCNLELAQLDKREAELAQRLGKALSKVNDARREAAGEFCGLVEAELAGLGFSGHARVRVEFAEEEVYPGLVELRGRLLWLPNPGQPPQPLDKIASGGELSRFLLAVTAIRSGSGEHLPTLLFDEVDAGVGGLTLGALADKLAELSRRQQVLVITHWPQLASRADRHFTIAKEVRDGETATRCQRLGPDEVRAELERMGGGGQQGRALAEELLRGR